MKTVNMAQTKVLNNFYPIKLIFLKFEHETLLKIYRSSAELTWKLNMQLALQPSIIVILQPVFRLAFETNWISYLRSGIFS